MAREYGAYQARSRFAAVIDDESGDALGTVRLITAGASPVKTMVDVAGEPWHLPVADSLEGVCLTPRRCWTWRA